MRLGKSFAADHAARCAAVLGVTLPASTETLRAAHRALVRQHHPDVGGDPSRFKEIQEAYDYLRAYDGGDGKTVQVDPNMPHWMDVVTASGDRLVDLGKGLGPRINSTKCINCLGKGWYKPHGQFHLTCHKCDGTGEIEVFNPVIRKMTLIPSKKVAK